MSNCRFLIRPTAVTIAMICVLVQGNFKVHAQEAAPAANPPTADPTVGNDFTPAIRLFPASVAGLVRIPDLPKVCDASQQTLLGQLMADPAMQPFLDSQRERARGYLKSMNDKVGLTAEELHAVASGEVVFAWLPFPSDRRRPFSLAVVADVRDRKQEVAAALKQIEADLTAGGWTRTDRDHKGQSVRLFAHKPKPGQLKIEQIAIFADDNRLIAADRDTVVTNLLDAIAGRDTSAKIADETDFETVLTRSAREIAPAVVAGGSTVAAEWFARPFAMGRIVRESLQVDRGNDVDVLKLLENQGFDAIKAAGGILALNGNKYDVLHKGFILAPPTAAGDQRYQQAAAMLQLPNSPVEALPDWIPETVGAVTRIVVRLENAFWSSESLVNEAVGDDIFRDMIEGIREDRDGPRIDLENNVLPNLDDFVLMLRDNPGPTVNGQIPADQLLVALRVRDGKTIATAVRKMMEAEPDATKVPGPPGVEIYKVQRSDESLENLEADLFGDFDDDPAPKDGPPPLLERWAIGLVPEVGAEPAYLMISSDDKYLAQMAARAMGVSNGVGALSAMPEMVPIREALKELAGDEVSIARLVRTRRSLRSKYQLLRQGKLKESDSLGASIFRRIVKPEDRDEVDSQAIDAGKLPPVETIEKYLPNGAAAVTTTEDGWLMSGFFLKEVP